MAPDTHLPPSRTQSSQSLDEGLLNLPSPYHDEFSLPPVSLLPKTSIASSLSNISSYLPFSLPRSPYLSLPTQDDSPNKPNSHTRKHKPRRHVHWADSSPFHHGNWVLPLSLLLLLSILINAFLLFEGRGRIYNTIPHDAYRVKERGRNYTCYHTRETLFKHEDAFERLDSRYDGEWRDMLGASGGYVRGVEGKKRGRARFAMFHQMECLEQIRMALRRDEEGNGKEKRKDFVVVNGGDGSARWGHCLDYLRQSVLCGADDTMEVSERSAGGWETFGYGSRRQCRDPKWLFDVTKCGEQGCEGGPFTHEGRGG